MMRNKDGSLLSFANLWIISAREEKTQREYKTLTPYELTQLTKELFKKISSKCALFLTTANQDNIQFYIKTIKN